MLALWSFPRGRTRGLSVECQVCSLGEDSESCAADCVVGVVGTAVHVWIPAGCDGHGGHGDHDDDHDNDQGTNSQDCPKIRKLTQQFD